MNRRVLAVCAGLIALSLAPGLASAAASPVLDQNNVAHDRTWVLSTSYAQIFKVGKTGSLAGVDLWMFTRSGTSAVTVSIEKLAGKAPEHPDGTPLASKAVAVGINDDWVHFDLAPLNVTTGEYLSIVISKNSAVSARGSVTDKYVAGYADIANAPWAYVQGSSRVDFAFRTYVGPTLSPTPAPGSAAVVTPSSSTPPTPTPTPTPTPAPTPSAAQTPAASVGATPVPGSGSGPQGGSGGAPLPIVAGAVVAVVLAGGGLWFVLVRRPRK